MSATSGETARDHCASYNWEVGTIPEVPLDPPSWSTRTRPIMVDACIAETVKALWAAGYVTLGSCCGHGKAKTPRPLLVLENGEQDLDGIRRVIAEVDGRTFTLHQWQLVDVSEHSGGSGS